MSVFHIHIIKNEPVFVSFERSKLLSEYALQDKETYWKLRMNSKEGKERKEAKKLEQKYLLQQFKKDPVQFRKNWVDFNLKGEEARINLFRLLTAYVVYHKKDMLFRDTRPPADIWDVEREIEDMDNRWPYGKNYNIVVKNSAFLKRNKMIVEYEINTDDILAAKGSIKSFVVTGKRNTIEFSKNILIKSSLK